MSEQIGTDLGGCLGENADHSGDVAGGHPVGRGGHRERRNNPPDVIPDRDRDSPESDLRLVDVEGVSLFAHNSELLP